jgi:5-methylcytosine-specific restriction protein A
MKLCSFLRLDPDYSGKGLSAGSKLDEEVWKEFAYDRDRLARTAWAIRANSKGFSTSQEAFQAVYEEEFPEGKILTRLHRFRETNQRAVRSKKRAVLEATGTLACAICDFDFHKAYGDIGAGFAECHDITPLTYLKTGVRPKLSELVILCSNCHVILHQSRPRISPQDLRKIVLPKRPSQ